MLIACIISDLDGTLASTEAANFAAYRLALAEAGCTLTAPAYAAAFGLRADELIRRVAPGLPAEAIAQVRARKAHHYLAHLHLVAVNHGLLAFLRGMRGQVVLGLATTASRANAEAVLAHIGARDLFDHLVFGEDVRTGKPDPECYRLIMARCAVAPGACLVFEDSAPGLAAAAAAGAQVVPVRLAGAEVA